MIRIYGASDDLIEVEGDISEEFNPVYYGDEDEHADILAFSDGTLLRVKFDRDSIWRITPVVVGKARLVHTLCVSDGFADEDYSDTVHLFDDGLPEDEQIKWVVQGIRVERRQR